VLKAVGPLNRNGSDFSFDFEFEMETGVVCPSYVTMQSATVVLGELAPGIYELTTTSWGAPVQTNAFIVSTNTTPMIQPIGFTADGTFQMQLNGVANVSYVLQSSSDLMNWTSLSTNSIGLPLTNKPPASPGWHFYRVQIPKTINPGPGSPLPAAAEK
ncbi:MAG TPA: hypothetical protein VKV04_23555, partial [Verrucomicrobiae bacterium]|nr:hypothetical protein [Verrucomicrobiae bacterium]